MAGHQYAELARNSTLADEALEGVELDMLQQPAAAKEAGETARAGDERMRRRHWPGKAFNALAVFAVAVQSPEGALVRAIQGRGVPVNVQLLWSSLGRGMVMLLLHALSGGAYAIPRTPLGWRLAAVAWVQGVAYVSASTYAFMRTTAMEACGIYYTYPVFVAALAPIVLHERVRTSTWLALLVAVACGVLLVVAPAGALHPTADARVIHQSDLLGDACAAVAGLALAAYLTGSDGRQGRFYIRALGRSRARRWWGCPGWGR